ncbi:MAG: ATP-binding cassette domain-containing protein [Clostridia bacterium]|nr:ATP-binding cassette domain-containing protein [Clostridia bacterium]
MLELKNIGYSVVNENGEIIHILKDINLKFDKGITVITGQNGSGKSTLIKVIMDINKAGTGQVMYEGENISKLSISERANLGFTLAFQQPVRFKGIKVKDLLDVANSKNNKVSDACEYLSKVGMCAKDYINREIDSTLSGGELKRIELAMALAKGGDVFLFDEPEAGIDLWSFDDLINIFKALNDKIVIIVSHQEKIIKCASKVIVLDADGGAKEYGTAKAIKDIKGAKCGRLGGGRE